MAPKKKKKPRSRPPSDPKTEFSEALDWFRAKVPVKKKAWLKMEKQAREKAFTVANVAQLDLIHDVHKALEKAIAGGETLEQFKRRVSDKLSLAWGEERPWHVETIFRTNLQMAYSRGRDAQLKQPEVMQDRPFWLFSAVLDDRTTKEICRPAHGTVLPAAHAWWKTHTPPLHHQCRSIKRALSAAQARKLGITKRAPKADAADGFGHPDPKPWQPDLTNYPAELVKRYRRKR